MHINNNQFSLICSRDNEELKKYSLSFFSDSVPAGLETFHWIAIKWAGESKLFHYEYVEAMIMHDYGIKTTVLRDSLDEASMIIMFVDNEDDYIKLSIIFQ